MWSGESVFGVVGPTATITFEVHVFANPAPGAPAIQILYPGVTFAPTLVFNNGGSATIGYVKVTNPAGNNRQWSFNTHSIPDGAVRSIFEGDLLAFPSSPLGPGSIRIDLLEGPPNGTYFLAATTAAGAYPHGWLFGLAISYAQLVQEITLGCPFTGPLNSQGVSTVGPFSGLPSGVTVYAVALGLAPGSGVPTEIAKAISHAIP